MPQSWPESTALESTHVQGKSRHNHQCKRPIHYRGPLSRPAASALLSMHQVQGEDEEGETEELVNSVLDEIGIDLNSTLLHAPGAKTAQPVQQVGLICCVVPKGGGPLGSSCSGAGLPQLQTRCAGGASPTRATAGTSACSCTSNSTASRMPPFHVSV
jgi:hypothetical protein